MNRHLKWLLALLLTIAIPDIAYSQDIDDELDDDELEIVDQKDHNKMVGKILSRYTPWERVELNGKLRMDGLPLSPSVKIFMEKDKAMMISVRAPFVGEVARVEADTSGAVVVNKMSKTYARLDFSKYGEYAPVALSHLQDLLLGRIFLLGDGTFLPDDADKVEIFGNSKEGFAVVPIQQPEEHNLTYGFEVNANGETTFAMFSYLNDTFYLMAEYFIKKKGKTIEFNLGYNQKEKEASLELDMPIWDATPMQPIALDRKYKPVEPKHILR